jgi:hypothetical protein
MLEMNVEGKMGFHQQCAMKLISWRTLNNRMDYVVALILWINCGKW